jgi:hypothetical protein
MGTLTKSTYTRKHRSGVSHKASPMIIKKSKRRQAKHKLRTKKYKELYKLKYGKPKLFLSHKSTVRTAPNDNILDDFYESPSPTTQLMKQFSKKNASEIPKTRLSYKFKPSKKKSHHSNVVDDFLSDDSTPEKDNNWNW